jgi:hypothetical protein
MSSEHYIPLCLSELAALGVEIGLPATELIVEKLFSHLIVTSQCTKANTKQTKTTEMSHSPSIPSPFINTKDSYSQVPTKRWGQLDQ